MKASMTHCCRLCALVRCLCAVAVLCIMHGRHWPVNFNVLHATSVQRCQATCVSGELRSLSEASLSSLHSNVNLFYSSCHHIFIFVGSSNLTASGYLNHPFRPFVKNELLLPQHTYANDFVSRPVDLNRIKGLSYVKAAVFNLDDSHQVDKYRMCMEHVLNYENSTKVRYSVFLRTRPDAFFYTSMHKLLDVQRVPVVYKTHADTSWVVFRGSKYFQNFGWRNDWIPSGEMTYLGWVMCRQPRRVGTMFNYLDYFIHHRNVSVFTLGKFCYRMHGLWNEECQSHGLTKGLHFPLDGSEVLHSFLDGNSNNCPCCHFKRILSKSPRVKHDVEICNFYDLQCHDNSCGLAERYQKLSESTSVWAKSMLRELQYAINDTTYCAVLAGTACDIVLNLRYIVIALGFQPSIRAFSHHDEGETLLSDNTFCSFAQEVITTIAESHDDTTRWLDRSFEQCSQFSTQDCYFWDIDCP